MRFIKTTAFLFLFGLCAITNAQDKYDLLGEKLSKLTTEIPALEEKVNISVTKVTIQEFLRGVANNTGLNIDVDPSLNFIVINNFSNVKVRDLLVYLCRQYTLDVTITGNIINVFKPLQAELPKPKSNAVKYDSINNIISLDYSGESLTTVVKEITKNTNKNIVLSPGLNELKVNGFIQNMPFDNALEKFMYGNNLSVTKTNDNFYVVESKSVEETGNNQGRKRSEQRTRTQQERQSDNSSLIVKLLDKNNVSVYAEGVSISDVIYEVAEKTNSNYYISGKLEDKASFKIDKATFADVLNYILNGTKYAYRYSDSIYIIGDDRSNYLKESIVIHLQNRTIEKLLESIPKALKENVEIVEFPDLNSFFVTGAPGNVNSLNDFIQLIDKSVPVILIEVMLVDISNSVNLTTGISAGIGDKPVTSQGTIFPGPDVTIGSETVNKFLKDNKRLGLENLGNVTPNFYMKLSALEQQGLATIRSTPKLSTLNGHEATLSIGNTQYYLEEQSSFMGTQNPVQSTMKVYKPLNAELSITIKPYVSGDEQITLDIEVKQSDFTSRILPTAPPGSLSRNFKSQIRVKNEDMVLLGGLEQTKDSDSGSGFPILSRIPIIKWFFSSREKSKSKSKLNIFIRPIIVG